MTNDEATENIILKFLLGMIFMPVSCAVSGITVKYLWGWFIVPLGVRPVGILWALGISILVGRLTYSGPASKDSFGMQIAASLGANGLMLLLGYIYHLYM